MSDDTRLERLAEAIVFAHDGDAATLAPDGDAAVFERTAALATAALAEREHVPPTLQARLATAALRYCGERAEAAPRRRIAVTAAPPARRWPTAVAFACGIAAGLVLWLALRGPGPADPTPAARRADLLAAAAADVRLSWQAGPSPLRGDVTGDVVWSNARQEGYLTFRGLPPLDPDHRFQLWIVDGRRAGAPVDGGVFAVGDAATETVVPVRPALPIGQAAAFVVTVEDKAGVVVSEQEHVVAIAGL